MRVCVCVYICTYMCHSMGTEDSLQESCNKSSSFHPHMGFELTSSGLEASIFTCWAILLGPELFLIRWPGKHFLVDPLQGTVYHVILYKHVAGCIDQFCSIAFTVGQFSHLIRKSNSALPQCGSLRDGVGIPQRDLECPKGSILYALQELFICVFPLCWACEKLKQQWIEAVLSLEPRWFSPWNLAGSNHCRSDEAGLKTFPWIHSQDMDICGRRQKCSEKVIWGHLSM